MLTLVMSPSLLEVYERLSQACGQQHWWPAESPFEVIVGAILVQNTAWKNVERAIENLREAGLLDPHALHATAPADLEELVRPAGYFRQMASRLLAIVEFLIEHYEGSLETMFAVDVQTLREELLSIRGVGPETADSILLYAGELPVFVVDTYTHRIFARHGWIEYECDYHALQDHCQSELPQEVQLYNELHALLVHVGNQYCKKSRPKCDDCPLCELLPEGGIVEGE